MIVDYFVQLDQDRIGFYNNLGTTFMVLFIPFGAILTILLPLYPTLIFIVGIFGLKRFEAVVTDVHFQILLVDFHVLI